MDKFIKKYLNYKCSSNQNQLKDTPDVYHSKLPYIGSLTQYIKENFNIKPVFN